MTPKVASRLALVLLVACGAPRGQTTPEPRPVEPGRARATNERPRRRLTLPEARHFMVELINADRKKAGLTPVELDEGPPTIAGQGHAEDMAKHGYLGHWGTDGSVPEQRLTEAGGADMVMENALCFTDERPRTLDKKPTFEARDVEKAEEMFFNEVPPNDGHRRNILKASHRKVGIGIAIPVGTETEIPVPCFAQEFTDPYGKYAELPKHERPGALLRVEGEMRSVPFGGVGIVRLPLPRPLSVTELNQKRSYPVPKPDTMYWPQGFKTPKPVQVVGSRFFIEVPLGDEPGLYEVSVWAKLPAEPGFSMVSLRTLRVER